MQKTSKAHVEWESVVLVARFDRSAGEFGTDSIGVQSVERGTYQVLFTVLHVWNLEMMQAEKTRESKHSPH
jgi:hypothetical protein